MRDWYSLLDLRVKLCGIERLFGVYRNRRHEGGLVKVGEDIAGSRSGDGEERQGNEGYKGESSTCEYKEAAPRGESLEKSKL